MDFFGNTPLALALQIKCDHSIIRILAEMEEVESVIPLFEL